MRKNFLTIFLIFLITSCVKNHTALVTETLQICDRVGLKNKIYLTKKFQIFTLQKISDHKLPLRIYLEGDGKAFISKNRASFDPTPTSHFLIKLIAADDYPNIIYIARPCQYVVDKNCQKNFWTVDRFSAEVIDSIDEVLKNFSKSKIELIGYSGGAAIGKYLLQRNLNIINFRTIAGNLDEKTFAEIHHVSSLKKAEAIEDLELLASIPQIHFIGAKDKIIPPIISKNYLDQLPQKSCVKIVTIAAAKHSKGWEKKWRELLEMKPECS